MLRGLAVCCVFPTLRLSGTYQRSIMNQRTNEEMNSLETEPLYVGMIRYEETKKTNHADSPCKAKDTEGLRLVAWVGNLAQH